MAVHLVYSAISHAIPESVPLSWKTLKDSACPDLLAECPLSRTHYSSFLSLPPFGFSLPFLTVLLLSNCTGDGVSYRLSLLARN